MKTFNQFHGEIPIDCIGKELRNIAKSEKSFKIMTGYGSTTGQSKSKTAALKSLAKMKKEGLIKGYIPGEKVSELVGSNDMYYETKNKYLAVLKADSDKGNDGIIFVFVKD